MITVVFEGEFDVYGSLLRTQEGQFAVAGGSGYMYLTGFSCRLWKNWRLKLFACFFRILDP
jgi:hypothetical protein